MPLDATYDQLMRLLSARGLEWFRQRVGDLPDPLPSDHSALPALAAAGRIAPALSGLRGHMSPLEEIVRRRLSFSLVLEASERLLDEAHDDDTAALVLAGYPTGAQEAALWQLAMSALADTPEAALVDRIAAAGRPCRAMLAEVEGIICAPMPSETITEDRIDGFARLVMQLYGFGATRPQFSHARIYGEVFTRLLRLADWAQRRGAVTAMAQTAFCLRLIDPDHDISPLIAEIISCQRPDGSFPCRAGHSTRDQELADGAWPTLMALAALNIAAWRRWRGPRPQIGHDRPLTNCRDHFAAALAPRAEGWAARLTATRRLELAAGMSRATGENWFARLQLRRIAPGRDQLLTLARQVFGDAYAARHARQTLDLDRHWPDEHEQGGDARAFRWLRGAAVAFPAATASCDELTSGELAERGAARGFDQLCREALDRPQAASARCWRAAARRHAREALRALDRPGAPVKLSEALAHLDRLCLMAQLFEGEHALAAAA